MRILLNTDGNATGTGAGGTSDAQMDGSAGQQQGGVAETITQAGEGDSGESLFAADAGDSSNAGNGDGSGGANGAGSTDQAGGGNAGTGGAAGVGAAGQGGQQQSGAGVGAAGGGGLTPEAIAELAKGIGQSIVQGQQRQQQQGQQQGRQGQQMDEAMFKKTFNVFEPTGEVLNGLRSEDPKVQMAAFIAMRDGIMKQALTMAEYQRQASFDKLMQEHITPVADYVRSEQDNKARETFWKGNPELRKFEAIVDATATKLISTGSHEGKSATEFHKLISTESRKVLQSAGINLTAQGQQGQGGQQANGNGNQRQNTNGNGVQRRNNMSTLTGGGQQSGGGGRGAAAKGPAGIEVFED